MPPYMLQAFRTAGQKQLTSRSSAATLSTCFSLSAALWMSLSNRCLYRSSPSTNLQHTVSRVGKLIKRLVQVCICRCQKVAQQKQTYCRTRHLSPFWHKACSIKVGTLGILKRLAASRAAISLSKRQASSSQSSFGTLLTAKAFLVPSW